MIFAELSRPIPRTLKLAPLQTYLRLSISKNPQRVAVVTGCGNYLIQLRFFDSSL
jgi:hypothetical protein